MKVHTTEKKIQKIKMKFPNLEIERLSEDSWEIKSVPMNVEKEVLFVLNGIVENGILEKEIKMAENPINKPISEITGNLSQAFSSLSSVIMGQASSQVAEIEKKITLLDNKIKESNQLLSSERLKMVDEQKAIVTKHVENLQKITNDLTNQVNLACQTVEKHVLELTAKFDEKNRDFSAAIERQKNKMAKLSVSVADALKD